MINKFSKSVMLFMALMLVTVVGCSDDDENNPIINNPSPSLDIVETAAANGNFTTLLAAAEAAGLVDDLKSEGPLTVFAPTDDAFAALPEGTIEALLNDIPTLTSILTYHVVAGEVKAEQVITLDSAKTLNGQSVNITVTDDGTVMVDNATVVVTDIETSNGIIHVIDAVIIPASTSSSAKADISGMTSDFSLAGSTHLNNQTHMKRTGPPIYGLANKFGLTTLATAIEAVGLNKTLNTDGPFTVFAPTEEAFAALPQGTLEALLADPDALTDILLYHVVAGEYKAADVVGLTQAVMLNGDTVSISLDGGVKINDANVIATDVMAKNGVVHLIDKVLIP